MTPRPAPLPRLRLASAVYRFRESLFALPALIVVVGVVVAEITALLDRTVEGAASAPWTVQMQANAATWLLSTVAGATITTAGVVFSLTVVSLQLASSQFSPRVMRSFIRDRFSQTVIGMLVATFVFCVLTLRHVTGDTTAPAPSIAMTVALALTVATVMLIVAFLDRLAHRLQVGEVIRSISNEADAVIGAMVRATDQEVPAGPVPFDELGDEISVFAVRDGWVSQAPAKYILGAVPPQRSSGSRRAPARTSTAARSSCESAPPRPTPTESRPDCSRRSPSPTPAPCNRTSTSGCANSSTSRCAH